MRGSGAFHRAAAIAAAISAAMMLHEGVALQVALHGISPYASHGKRKTRAHPAKAYRRVQRAARKAINVKRNRKAHRG